MPVTFNFGIIQILMFACAAAVIVFIFAKGLSEKDENNKAPVQTVYARIVGKRIDSYSADSLITTLTESMVSGERASGTQYYVTFEAPDGSRLELRVKESEYGMLAEGDYGELTFQRKRYISFNRQAAPEQMLYAQQIQEQAQLNQAMPEQTLPQSTPQNFIQTDDGDQRTQF